MVLRDETRKAIDNDIKKMCGMSYDEFSNLDVDEQQRIIQKHCHRNCKRGNGRIMIGSGEHAEFVDKSDLGITPDEYRQRQEIKINQIIGEEKGFRKVLSLFNGRNR